jgi:beta-lactamase regulating signal transducer with metallopeptidase domain
MNTSAAFASASNWLPFVAELAAKATLVLLLAAVVAALLWRSSAAVRHLVWCVGIVGVLALPLFSLLLPAWELPLLPSPEVPGPVASDLPGAPAASLEIAARSAGPVPDAGFAAAPAEAGAWLPAAVLAVGAAGMAAGLLWLAVGFWGVARLVRRAEVVGDAGWLRAADEAAAQLGLRRRVRLLRSEGAMPATGGIFRPIVVIPATADAWPDDRRRAVLAHELAHVKRCDCLTQALAQVACALFWWHPAVWYAARRLRVERERACDDLVLRAGTRPSDYAAHLLEVARAYRGMRMATPALVGMARPSHLESRLLWVLDAARVRGAPSARATVLTVLLALLGVGSLSALRPTAAEAGTVVREYEGPVYVFEGVEDGEDEEKKKDEERDKVKDEEKAAEKAADKAADRAAERAAENAREKARERSPERARGRPTRGAEDSDRGSVRVRPKRNIAATPGETGRPAGTDAAAELRLEVAPKISTDRAIKTATERVAEKIALKAARSR